MSLDSPWSHLISLVDVKTAAESRQVRCGAGKTRNRRYTQRKGGPLLVYDISEGLDKTYHNLSGVDLANVDNLSLLDLAPGGHLGRFIMWTKGELDSLFGMYRMNRALSTRAVLICPGRS